MTTDFLRIELTVTHPLLYFTERFMLHSNFRIHSHNPPLGPFFSVDTKKTLTINIKLTAGLCCVRIDSVSTCPAGLTVSLCLLNTQSSIVGPLSLFLMHCAKKKKKVPYWKVISSPCDVINVFTHTHTHCALSYCLRLSEGTHIGMLHVRSDLCWN